MSSREHDSANPVGRPRKADGPRLPYDELDRILVFGEVVPVEGGAGTMHVFPSYRELAARYGVSHTVINRYARQHNCMRRRAVARERIAIKADQKMVELRATAIALSRDDELRIIDAYLVEFEKAVADGRVRFDSVTDFNTMIRLKQFLQGGADSRQEVHASLTLEDLQERHRRAMKQLEEKEADGRPSPTGSRKQLAGNPISGGAAPGQTNGSRCEGGTEDAVETFSVASTDPLPHPRADGSVHPYDESEGPCEGFPDTRAKSPSAYYDDAKIDGA